MKKFLLIISLIFVGTASAFIAACENNNTVKYSFNTNGGTEISEVTMNKGEDYELPIPVKDGFEFEGWYLTDNFSGTPVTNASEEENTTYYAKWSQLYTISLQLDGGSLGVGTSLKLKEGANVYDFMSGYTPTKSGLEFGAWFNGETELARNLRMPTTGLTLTAKYKVGYTVEIYKQNIAGDGYEKDEQTISGSEYIGTTVAPEYSAKGFYEVANQNAVTSKQLSGNASENVFKLYFDRDEFTVSLRTNYPDGTEGNTKTYTVKYGEKIELLNDLVCEGYLLTGWSTSDGGEAEYPVNYIDSVLYGSEAEIDPVYFTVENDESLYAVWVKGATDLFASAASGSKDFVYLIGEKVYLSRGNVFFEGRYVASNKRFYFYDANNTIVIEGTFISEGVYCYSNSERGNFSAKLLTNSGISDKATIYLGRFNDLTYSERATVGQTEESKGTYTIEDDSLYVVTYTEGPLSGQTMRLVIGITQDSDGANVTIFRVRNEEEVALGEIIHYGLMENGEIGIYNSGNITLDGLGSAFMANANGSTTTYSYVLSEDNGTKIIKLTPRSGAARTLHLIDNRGRLGYFEYYAARDIVATSNGATLTLDGTYNAILVEGANTYNGRFVAINATFSQSSGFIINFIADGTTRRFVITSHDVQTEDKTVTEYVFEEKLLSYAEYYYQQGGYIYYMVLAIDDEVAGKASVYQRINGEWYKVAVGSYKDEDGKHLFTTEQYIEHEEVVDPIVDMSTVQAFVFDTAVNGNYNVIYWLSSTTKEGDAEPVENAFTTEYVATNTNATVTLVATYAIYKEADQTAIGEYSTDRNGITAITTSGNTIYVILDEEAKTFFKLESAPYTASERKPSGSADSSVTLDFDGTADGAAYNYVDGEEEIAVEGKFANSNRRTAFGSDIYTFTATDGSLTFDYILLYQGNSVYFARYNAHYSGVFTGADNSVLTMDGFLFTASYLDASGNNYQGIHILVDDDIIAMLVDGNVRYFDIKNNSFDLRGQEYGSYVVRDNFYYSGVVVRLDGYGKAVVLKTDSEADEGYITLDENATYSKVGDLITVTYGEKSIIGKVETVQNGNSSYNYLVIIHTDVAQTYVNPSDYSIIILDELGGAVIYSAQGVRESGDYVMITDNLLYFVSDGATSESDASTYRYNVQAGTAETISLQQRGYFTADFDSILFRTNGIVTFNSQDVCYYEIEDGKVYIYRQAEEGEADNGYGFIKTEFGKFDKTVAWAGKTYYANTGYAIEFNRGEEGEAKNNYPLPIRWSNTDENKYPIQALNFTPPGTPEFAVRGTVRVVDKNNKITNLSCTIVHTEEETYIAIAMSSTSYLRFDIELKYLAEDEQGRSLSTYTVLGESYVLSYASASYAYAVAMYQWLDSLLGTNYAASITNTIGTIEVCTDYDETGTAIGDPYVNGVFGEDSGMYDANGNIFGFEKAEFSYNLLTGIYTIDVKGEDGYDYRIRFNINSTYGGYQLLAFTRVQEFEIDGDYKLVVERLVSSDNQNYTPGFVYTAVLYKGETEIPMTTGFTTAGTLTYINRTLDENDVITSTVYYNIRFIEKSSEIVGDDEVDANVILPYETATMTVTEVTTTYSEDGKSYVDIADGKVLFISVNGTYYIVTESEFDAVSGMYKVKTYTNEYTVKIEEGKAVIAVVEASEEDNTTGND